MKLKLSDVLSILSGAAGVCGILSALILTTTVSVQAQLHPGAPAVVPAWAIISSAVIGAVGTFAAQVIRVFNVKAGAPATAYTADVAVVPTGTAVVTENTPVVAQNATNPIPIPQKGTP
jgi:hypothetical protein